MKEQVEDPIKGLHTLSKNGAIKSHIVVDQGAQSYSLKDSTGELEKLYKLKGSHVHKTYMMNSQALTQASIRSDAGAGKLANLMAVISKDTPVQIWDVDHQKKGSTAPLWFARNVPNDELSLAVPIYDTSLTQCASNMPGRILATSTAYG